TRHPEAGAHFAEAGRLLEDLVGRHPSVPLYRERLAITYTSQAGQQRNVGKEADAADSLRKAEAILGGPVRLYPGRAAVRVSLGESRTSRGAMALTAGDFAEAHRQLTRSLQTIEAALPKMQDTAYVQNKFVDTRALLADALMGLGRHTEALAEWDRVLAS